MSRVIDEMIFAEEDVDAYLMHIGTKRHSGRYPWGSGEDPYQHSRDFLARVESLKKKGLTEAKVAESIGLSSTQLRVQVSLAKSERRAEEVAKIKKLKDKGYSNTAIAEKLGLPNESSVRSLLDKKAEERMKAAMNTATFLKDKVDKKGMIDVGKGVERELNISREKFNQALYLLEREGYPTYGGSVHQATNAGQTTHIQVLCPPGTDHKDIYNFDKINSLREYTSRDNGETFNTFQYPSSLDPKRLKIRYAEEGGINKDGVIEVRRGVDDISLGNSNYAQVRVLVGKDRYLKGMAVYGDNMPDGVDVIFNTNKKQGTPMDKVLKEVKKDKDGNIDSVNPFGSLIGPQGQSTYIDKNGKEKLRVINKTRDEGDWNDWAKKIPSQFLGKQKKELIDRQLKLTAMDKKAEFDDINALTNPTIKKQMLKDFADGCDSAAVHLKAATLPRQRYQVILPLNSIKDTEVYAPNFKDGEKVALVRFPHGGTFEIPILTVNNKNKEATKTIGKNPLDAVGINSKVAERLSGADFDGDTVLVIPTGKKVKITSTPALEELKDFDPKTEYGPDTYAGKNVRLMSKANKQKQMGVVSNLITDMTLKGADEKELARAVRHSMVVIDAEKHKLDYKQSEIDNGIKELKRIYQGHYDENGKYKEGASTLLSRAKSEERILKRVGTPKINQKGKPWYDESKPEGAYIYKSKKEEYVDKNGKTQLRTIKSTKMAEVDDAYKLSSGTLKENAYADYANYMKALANSARKEMVMTKDIPYSPSAKAVYSKEYDSLDRKLRISSSNIPRERQAQIIANAAIKSKKLEYPDMDKDEEKKIRQQEISRARIKVGAERTPIQITDREWEAIQAGAITATKLKEIIKYVDSDKLKERATPRTTKTITPAKEAKIRNMKASGLYTNADIAEAIGVSISTINKYK